MHDVDLGLEVLLDGPRPTLWDIHTQREALRFLRKRGQDIRGERLDNLTEAILKGPPRHLYRNNLTDDQWISRRDHEIRLRLQKLTESGATLPTSAQEVYDRIQHDLPWQPCGDHSEEFIVFSSSSFIGNVDQNNAATRKNFADMSIERFIQWSGTQTGEPWEWGEWDGGWGQFAGKDIKVAVKLLKGAADNKSWPIPPWWKILDALGQKGKEDVAETIKHEVADLLVNMPPEELAKLDFQPARWLEGTWQKLGEKQRRELWGRIWSAASLLNEAPQGGLNYDTPLNHTGGILGYILYEEMTWCILNVSAGENPGFPNRLRLDFEKIAVEDHPSAQLARVRLAPMLAFLYRIDPDWTECAFFRRMDPDDEATFDPHLWEGYIRFGRWSTDLLRAFKPLLLRTLQGSDLIPVEVRHRGVGLFVHMAVPPDRGIDMSEAKSALWGVGTDGLPAAAEALGDILRGAGDKSFALWRDTVGPWFAGVWPRRTQDRSKDLSHALACMAMDSGDAFPDVVNAIEDILTPEKFNAALYNLNQATDLVSRYPDAALILADKIFGDHGHGDSDLLRKVLEAISTAKPKLKRTDSFKRLVTEAK